MMWQPVKLKDISTKITKGTTPSNIGESFSQTGVNYIRSEMLTQSKYINKCGLLFISSIVHEKMKRSQLEAGDILFSMAGVYLGKTAILKYEDVPANTNQAVALIRVNTNLCNRDFIYYYLNQPVIIKYINQVSGQAAQPNINLQQIGAIDIDLPDRAIQNNIADILSAYDDLIENNQKQIKLLEEAAMRLYKEWFVYLRFPGYENTPIVDGVPEGWERAFTKEFVEFNYGKALKAGDRIGTKYPVYGSSGIVGYHDKFLVEAPAVIVGRKGNVGSVFISFENAFPIDTVYFISTDLSPYYMYLELKFRTFVNSDAAVPGLNRTFALSMEMLRPSDSILEKFDAQVSGLFELQRKLNKQSTLLQQARDKLLPKLMSGEIEV